MKKIKFFEVLIALFFLQGCARDVAQKTLVMLDESKQLEAICLNGRFLNSFKGSISTIFIDCEAKPDLSRWLNDVRQLVLGRGWILQSRTSSDVYCLEGIKLTVTPLEKTNGRSGLILQYPSSRCEK